MEAVLKFNLPEENDEFRLAVNAVRYASALEEIREFLRTKIKYTEFSLEGSEKAYEEIYEKYFEIIDSHGLKGEI